MKTISLLLTLLLLTLLTSCGEPQRLRKRITIHKNDLTSLLKDQKIECASLDNKECPKGLARIFIYNPTDENDSSTCSGFLNSGDRVVTNNHCVATAEECKNTYITIYNGHTYESVRCRKILTTKVDVGPLKNKSNDYSVLEIDRRLEINALPISQTDPQLGENLSAWVIDHLSLNSARVTELNCTYTKKAYSLQLSYCPVIQGNSGSPLLNSYGEVAGLIWGSTVGDEIDGNYPLIERRELSDFAFATEIKQFRNYLKL